MTNFRHAASSATRLPPIGLDLSTPDGLAKAVAIGAADCLKCAIALDNSGFSDLTGEYILTFHAIELGLKAFLIKHGMFEKDLSRKPYGHNLVCLFGAAKERGLSLNIPDVDDMLTWINEWHNDGVKIRYRFDTVRELPMCCTIFPLAEAILATTGNSS
jgi:hypothetical protein